MPRTRPFPPVVLLLGLIALVFGGGDVGAATTINSNITSDTTWTAAGSPYRVVVSITVMPGAVLTGVETRTSSPLRITRGADLQSLNTRGLYPAGEGAGYAGGILSAGVDGLKVAEALAKSALGLDAAH